MTPLPNGPPEELPIWKGRRGWINAAGCCLLALPCAFGLWSLAERSVIVPACTAYANAHAMTYADFKLNGVKQSQSTVVCVLTQADGRTEDTYLHDLVPFVTTLWVEFAMDLTITVPGFAVLLGLLRVGLYKNRMSLT